MARAGAFIARSVLAAGIAWALWLPLADVLSYPDRVSVLPNLETDAAAYDGFAQELSTTWRLSALPSKHPPGWMVMLATVYALVGHSYVAGKLVSWTALLLAVACAAWLARRAYGRSASAVAALLCASSPGLRGYIGTLQYEVVTAGLFALLLALSTRVCEAKTRKTALARAVLAGATGAVLVLTRETFVLAVPAVAWWAWRRLRRTIGGHDALVAGVTLLVVAAVPAIIWSTAQTAHHERLILIAEKGPKEFQLGNHPLANGTYNEPLVGMAEPAGLAFVRAHPLATVRLTVRKVLYFFGVLRDGWNVPQPAAVWIWRATTGAIPMSVIEPVLRGGWLLTCCLAGLWLLGREGLRQWWGLPVAVGTILAAHVTTISSFRFAVPVLPVLYVLASGPVASLGRAAVPLLRTPSIAVGCIVIAALAVGAQYRPWPLHVRYDAADLDGVAASNDVDDTSGRLVRFADARRGLRPVALLSDTYLPRGSLVLTVQMRRSRAEQTPAPLARVALLHLDGQPACVAEIGAEQVPTDRFVDIALPCRLTNDGPATIAIYTLGRADLAIDQVWMDWVSQDVAKP
jgi:4-amino-4-deoxy-L-arabinose transferase-like glycosyltransferase